jgi:hypothetical protein
VADRSKLYDNPAPKEDEGESWKHFKTGKALKEKRGDRRTMDGKEYEAVGHSHEEPEKFRSMKDEEGDAGSGTLRGKPFDRTTNDGILWHEVKEKPVS